MTEDQVFFLFFLQTLLNFFLFYFFTQKYSETTQMFLDHISDMYSHGLEYHLGRKHEEDCTSDHEYEDEDEEEDEDEDEEEYTDEKEESSNEQTTIEQTEQQDGYLQH